MINITQNAQRSLNFSHIDMTATFDAVKAALYRIEIMLQSGKRKILEFPLWDKR